MQLYDHQKKIIEEDPKRALIAHGTGGGKTFTCLSLAWGRTLVVCPKQQKLDKTWEKNAEKFGLPVDLTVVSKEDFRRDARSLLPYFDTVICDECHTVLGVSPETRMRKGRTVPKTSQLFEETLEYLERTQPSRIYLASATPVTKPMNLWALAKLLGKNWDFFKFRDYFHFEKKIGFRSLWIPKRDKKTKEKLASLTKSFGYTGQLSDWFDVPEQKHETIYVSLTTEQSDAISRIESEEADPMAVRARIRTIENGILYETVVDEIGGIESKIVRRTRSFASRKLDAISDILEKNRKVLIFAAYTGQIASIAERLQFEYPRRRIWTLTGQTPDRGTVIQAAEEAEEAIVIAQASISAGYELPSFRCTVFASKSYRVVDYIQALGRTLRANALHENHFYHLVVKGGPDEACHKAIQSGEDFQELLMTN